MLSKIAVAAGPDNTMRTIIMLTPTFSEDEDKDVMSEKLAQLMKIIPSAKKETILSALQEK